MVDKHKTIITSVMILGVIVGVTIGYFITNPVPEPIEYDDGTDIDWSDDQINEYFVDVVPEISDEQIIIQKLDRIIELLEAQNESNISN